MRISIHVAPTWFRVARTPFCAMWTPICVAALLLTTSLTAGADESNPGKAETHGAVSAKYRADLAGTISGLVERDLGGLVAFCKERHAHPELSLQEKESAEAVAGRLEASGYTVTRGVGGFGVVGVLHNGDGPTVLIRGDMDALPITEATDLPYRSTVTSKNQEGQPVGVMHACGHDIHMTCLVGAAAVLAETKEHWRGTVIAIGQPAEEVGKGALAMIEDGLFDRFGKPDYCIALHVSSDHPAGVIGYTSGWALANVDSVDITIHGRGGHGSRPDDTIDPVVAAAQVIVALQTIVSRRVEPIEPAVITVGSIHAGSKHNIISDEAKMQLTVRSYTDKTRKILLDGIRQVTVNTCRAMGCTQDPDVVFREDEYTPASYNDPELTAAAVGVMREALGAEQVIEVPARMGGEDFGRYARHLDAKGFMFWLGSVKPETVEAAQAVGSALPPLHSSTYTADPEPTITTGVKCLSSIALSLLNAAD